jgi:hypothetical protein
VKNLFISIQTSCGQTIDNVIEDQITSTESIAKEKYLRLYPNPSKDLIFIEAPNDFKSTCFTFIQFKIITQNYKLKILFGTSKYCI